MGKIFQYSQSVQPTGSTGYIGQAEYGAGSGLMAVGGAVTASATDYLQKKVALKYKSDVADYELRRRELSNDIESSKIEALKEGKTPQEILDTVVQPQIDDFGMTVKNSGYLNNSAESIGQDWKIKAEGLTGKYALEVEQAEIMDYATKQRDLAFMQMNDGDTEGANVILDDLANIVGAEKVSEWKSLGIYDKNIRLLTDTTSVDAIDELSLSDEVKNMKPSQYQSFRRMADSRIRDITSTIYAPTKKLFAKQLGAGELTTEMVENSQLPDNEKTFYIANIARSIGQGTALNQEAYDDGVELVDGFLDGNKNKFQRNSKDSYSKLLEDIRELELPPDVELELMRPIIDGQGNKDVNAIFYTKKEEWNGYDTGIRPILNRYRNAHRSATRSFPASVRSAEFGTGYKKVYQWIDDNKKDIEAGTYDEDALNAVIEEASYPAIKLMLDRQAQAKSVEMLTGRLDAE